ncbi:galactose-1-phosphate uridylyltransferase [Streptomyces sp. NPDC059629]|uniref:galactose-1-phosphate uridylyltransferase n=1 Tax=Streptomyces sp. NPDC059629 TaxID=3346889 RepID=UPI0036C20C01
MSRPAPRSARLADGRALYLFDDHEHDGRAHRAVPIDRRRLPPPPPRNQLRWDPLTDEWVVIAPHRLGRARGRGTGCALCPSTPGAPTEIPADTYDVAVFENRFPALHGAAEVSVATAEGTRTSISAAGRCEVIAFSSEHHTAPAELSVHRIGTVVEAWIHRTRALNALPGVVQVVCFENRGAEIGATQSHPHGQIYGYPFEPARLRRMREAAWRSRGQGVDCLHCHLLKAEERDGERLVLRTDRWTAFVPFAARWPYEVHLYPRRHVSELRELDASECRELAEVYRSLLRRFQYVDSAPLPYMALWVQAPARGDEGLTHLHAQLFSDRFSPGVAKRLAAGELGAGTHVSEAVPEETARRLRAVTDADG